VTGGLQENQDAGEGREKMENTTASHSSVGLRVRGGQVTWRFRAIKEKDPGRHTKRGMVTDKKNGLRGVSRG